MAYASIYPLVFYVATDRYEDYIAYISIYRYAYVYGRVLARIWLTIRLL